MTTLNDKQIRHLRRLGHDLKPVVLMGGAGLTAAVQAEIDKALDDHELIKVKTVADDRDQRRELIERICIENKATLVQAIGNIALIFRRSRIEKKRRIALP
ncbi:MAG: YhbY family RNA-binding protein [Aquisalimonadaceae bacterium]